MAFSFWGSSSGRSVRSREATPIFQSYILIILYASVRLYVRSQEDLWESPPFQGLKDRTFFSDLPGSLDLVTNITCCY